MSTFASIRASILIWRDFLSLEPLRSSGKRAKRESPKAQGYSIAVATINGFVPLCFSQRFFSASSGARALAVWGAEKKRKKSERGLIRKRVSPALKAVS